MWQFSNQTRKELKHMRNLTSTISKQLLMSFVLLFQFWAIGKYSHVHFPIKNKILSKACDNFPNQTIRETHTRNLTSTISKQLLKSIVLLFQTRANCHQNIFSENTKHHVINKKKKRKKKSEKGDSSVPSMMCMGVIATPTK